MADRAEESGVPTHEELLEAKLRLAHLLHRLSDHSEMMTENELKLLSLLVSDRDVQQQLQERLK